MINPVRRQLASVLEDFSALTVADEMALVEVRDALNRILRHLTVIELGIDASFAAAKGRL